MAKLFGESISKDVVKQLEQRESILATGARDSQHLRYLNEKTAWVRAISGANLLQSDSKYTSTAASNFILSGGLVKWDTQNNKFVSRSGAVNLRGQESGRYSYNESLGVRPEPGITSFSIAHKNRYGTIREAQLSFTVWTREDLEKAHRLYLRPGTQVIVEWGNSVYVDNDGSVEDIPNIEQYGEYFKNIPIEKVYTIINAQKISSSYNYDGFLGFVINFTWKYRMDGGYDCSLSIISRSVVLESLTLLKPNQKKSADRKTVDTLSLLHQFAKKCESTPVPNIGIQKYRPFTGISYLKSTDANYLTIDNLSEVTFEKEVWSTQTGRRSIQTITEPTNFKQDLFDSDNNYVYRRDYVNTPEESVLSKVKVYGFDSKSDVTGKKTTYFRYTTLRVLLALINKSYLLSESSKVELPTFYLGQPLEEVTISPQVYRTFKEHVSLDPSFAILPKVPSFTDEETKRLLLQFNQKYTQLFNYHNAITGESGKDGINPFRVIYNGVSDSIAQNPDFSDNDILDIHINICSILPLIDTFINEQKEPNRINVRDLVKSILDKINFALGNINELDIHFDEDLQKFIILDRAIVNENFSTLTEVSENDIRTINVAGLKTTISNITLQSKISSELSSMIAISNQAVVEDDPNSSRALIDFNAGTENRFYDKGSPTGTNENIIEESPERRFFMEEADFLMPYPQRIEDPDAKEEVLETVKTEASKREEFYYQLSKAYASFNSGLFKDPLTEISRVNLTSFEKLKSEGFLVFKKQVFNSTYEVGDQGILPIDLSLTTDGLSGLKIGQLFKIGRPASTSNILPEAYDNYCFIITGLDSTIENNKWLSTIRAQTFKIR